MLNYQGDAMFQFNQMIVKERNNMNYMYGKFVFVIFFFALGICSLVLPGNMLYAQSTTLKLPTAANTSTFTVTDSSNTALMKMFGDGGFYLKGTLNTGAVPIEGAGTRLLWYPKQAAFRAGGVTGTQWDDSNIGQYSVALGTDTKASGWNGSVAMGNSTTASGITSTALGGGTTASGSYSTATGYQTTASANYSTAMGYQTTASGDYSAAMGTATTASGLLSTSMGFQTIASGDYSTAVGFLTIASGNYSTAMGNHVSTNGYAGAFIIGDKSTGAATHISSAANEMTMRFAGGYRLFTNSAANLGVSLAGGGSSWNTISDSTKKTNFLKADGEYFLSSLSKLKLGSWNYKTQNVKQFRHYGPMAQEIFHYFGNDGIGTIGNDTTLATADMDGIMMICLQALEKEVRSQKSEVRNQRQENDELKEEVKNLKQELELQKETITALQNKFSQFKNTLSVVSDPRAAASYAISSENNGGKK